MHGCCLSLRLYSRPANCPNAVFSSNGFRNTHCTKLSCLWRLPLPETSPRSLFDVHDLDAFVLSCNLSLHLDFASVFLELYSGYTTLAGISQSDTAFISLYPVMWPIISICPITSDVHFDPLLKVISARHILHENILLPSEIM